MKSVIAACFVILGCLVHEAKAQQAAKLPAVDFSTMTCEQFWEKTTAADRGPFLFWLSGYFSHKKNSAVLDPADLPTRPEPCRNTAPSSPTTASSPSRRRLLRIR